MENEFEVGDLVRYHRMIIDGKYSRRVIGIGHIQAIDVETSGVIYYKIHDLFVNEGDIIFRIPIDLMR